MPTPVPVAPVPPPAPPGWTPFTDAPIPQGYNPVGPAQGGITRYVGPTGDQWDVDLAQRAYRPYQAPAPAPVAPAPTASVTAPPAAPVPAGWYKADGPIPWGYQAAGPPTPTGSTIYRGPSGDLWEMDASQGMYRQYTPPSAPAPNPGALSTYGGIDPNYITSQVAPVVQAWGGLPQGLLQYLTGTTGQSNAVLQAADAPGLLGGLNNFLSGYRSWDMSEFSPSVGRLGQMSTQLPPGLLPAGEAFYDASQGGLARGYQPVLDQRTQERLGGPSQAGQQDIAALEAGVVHGLRPFIEGQVGDIASSPTMAAAVDAWKQNVLPVVQQQMQLAGLGRSAAVGNAAGESLTSAMLPILQNEFTNRLQASNQGTGLLNAISGAQQWMGQQQLQGGEQQLAAIGQQLAGGNQRLAGAQGLQAASLGLNAQQMQAAQSLLQGGLSMEQLRQSGLLQGTGLGLTGARDAAQLQQQTNLAGANILQQGGQAGVNALQQGLSLEQQAMLNASNIANMERQRQMQAAQTASGIIGSLAQALLGGGTYMQQQQGGVMQAGAQAGQVQRDIQQQAYDAQMMDYLRRQALAEASTYGLFGGAVLPKTLQTATSSSGGK